MKTFEEWCNEREIVINELSPKFLTMAYKIWGEECFVEGQRYEAENAALRERLEKAAELPSIRKHFTKDGVVYELVYKDDLGFVHTKWCDRDDVAESRLAELKGE